MCWKENRRQCCCEKPHRLKDRPKTCTAEQIRECHGEAREHPCACEGEQA
jgi:hypothetical protein